MFKRKYIVTASALITLILSNATEVNAEIQENSKKELTVMEDQNISSNQQSSEEIDFNGEEPTSDSTFTEIIENPHDLENSQKQLDKPNEITEETKNNITNNDLIITEKSNVQTVELLKTAEEYYIEYYNAFYVSDLWTISQQFKNDYPEHHKLHEVINDASTKNLVEALNVHKNKNFSLAKIYYNRIINEPLVSSDIKSQARVYLKLAESSSLIKTSNDYYSDYNKAYYVSDLWMIAQDFKTIYPGDTRLSKLINDAANKNLTEGQKAHRNNNYTLALIYYNRVLEEPLVNSTTKSIAGVYAEQAESEEMLKTADDYYNDYNKAYYVSDLWMIAQKFKETYPNDKRLLVVVNDAASKNLSEGLRVHRNKNYELALVYYNRVLEEPLASLATRTSTVIFAQQASSKIPFKTANDYYNEYNKAHYVSDLWMIAQEFKEVYPNDSRLPKIVNDVADKNLIEGQRAHRNKDYALAMIYYNRVLSERFVNDDTLIKTEVLAEYAKNKKVFKTANEYFNEYNKAYYVSDLWMIAQEFKEIYPNDSRLPKIINDVADKNLIEGQRAHRNKDYALAMIYYNRVLSERFINDDTLNKAEILAQYAKNKKVFKTANEYFNEYNKAYYVSDLWMIAQEFNMVYPNNSQANELLNKAANMNITEGRSAQKRGDGTLARIYYNRILDNIFVDESIRYLAAIFLKQTAEKYSPIVYVDAGHGGSDPGATSNRVSEKTLNLNVANYLRRELESRGYIVIMSRERDTTVGLSARPFEANNLFVDAFISVHHNSMGGSGTGRGIETFVYHRLASGSGQERNRKNFKMYDPRIKESVLLADQIHSNLINSTGLYNRGVKGENFNVIRNSYAPAVLLELGFMDNLSELSIIRTRSYQEKAARSVAIGIDNYFKQVLK